MSKRDYFLNSKIFITTESCAFLIYYYFHSSGETAPPPMYCDRLFFVVNWGTAVSETGKACEGKIHQV